MDVRLLKFLHELSCQFVSLLLLQGLFLRQCMCGMNICLRLFLLETDKLKTIPVGLVTLQSALKTDFPVLISGLVISAGVVIIVCLIFQKQFVRGLTQGSVKG